MRSTASRATTRLHSALASSHVRPARRSEIRGWDDLIQGNPDGGQILQTRAWGEFKRRWGWKPSYCIAATDEGEIAVLMLQRWVPGFGQLWYAPKGPGVNRAASVTQVLADRAAMTSAFLVKVEPEIDDHRIDHALWKTAGLRKARSDVQISRATIVVDLSLDEDALLASFKPKTRYNIRLAGRKGVLVEPVPADDDNTHTMFTLMAQTQARAGFFLRQERYFREYWQLQAACGQGQLFFATWQGKVLAGVFATHLGARGWYKDGGSVKAHSELMAPHLLQWEVMRWLRERGVRAYDLVAVPRPSELAPEHPLFGLYRFKSGFNETITEFTGTWDLPLRSRAYAVWERLGERALSRVTRQLHSDLLY